MSDILRERKTLMAVAAILLIGGISWGLVAHAKSKKTTLPKDLAAAIQASAQDPGKLMQVVHAARERKDLTEEQHHVVWESVHGVWEVQMNQRMNEYFAAPVSQRQAIMDRQLDEMVARRKEMEKQFGPRNGSGSQPSGGAGMAGGPGGNAGAQGPDGGHGRWGGRGQPTRAQRKERSESRSPERSARHMAYFGALQQRAQQRGIQMPFGGRGRGG